MKCRKSVLFLILLLLSCFFSFSQSNIDILHYKFSITLNDANDTIAGSATIKLKFLQPDSMISLDLVSKNSQGKGMKIDKIISNGSIAIKSYAHENNKVIIIYSHSFVPADSILFTIYYHGIPADGLIISKNKYGDRTFFADNWPDRARNWIPCVDDPADKASLEFFVTAPDHYRVISNGVLEEEIFSPGNTKHTHWKEDIPLPTKIMVIGVADFAVKKYSDSPPNIPVTAWIFTKDSVNGFKDYSLAPGILKFLNSYIGPYPFNKLANVQSKTIFGGMENANAIFYYENSVDGKQDNESLLAHEITHQWFGDMVTEKSFAHLWLSEGFATYFQHLYIESRYGTDSFNTEMQNDRERIITFSGIHHSPVVDSVSSFRQLLNTNSYEKAGWILHMLRKQLGDTVFQKIIRAYYDTYKGKNADTNDFEIIAEKISGKSLDRFIKQWLFGSGIPRLAVRWKYNSADKKMVIEVEQLQMNEPFTFPLDIMIVSETGKSRMEKLTIGKKKEIFTLPMNNPPRKIIADPGTALLYEGFVQELK